MERENSSITTEIASSADQCSTLPSITISSEFPSPRQVPPNR
jgi:hypothetical protein